MGEIRKRNSYNILFYTLQFLLFTVDPPSQFAFSLTSTFPFLYYIRFNFASGGGEPIGTASSHPINLNHPLSFFFLLIFIFDFEFKFEIVGNKKKDFGSRFSFVRFL